MSIWVIVGLAGVGSYLLRLSMIALVNRVRMPERFEEAATFIAPAAFAALAAAGIAARTVTVSLIEAIPVLVAVGVAVVVATRTGRPYLAVLVGMPTLWILTAAVGA
jgi:branched-subunit amino acid transport protein